MRESLAAKRKPLHREVIQQCCVRGLVPDVDKLVMFCNIFDKACEARRQYVLAEKVRLIATAADAADEDLDVRTC